MSELQTTKEDNGFEKMMFKVGVLVGLSNKVNSVSSMIIAEYLAEEFKGIKISDIDRSFKMLTSGKLDEFLPEDKNGNPDRNHYGELSASFVSKVLAAYIQYNNRYKPKKKQTLLSEKANSVEIERQAQRRKEEKEFTDNQIIEQFDNFIKYGGFDFLIKQPIYLRLQEIGLLENLPPCKEKPFELAQAMLMKSKVLSPIDRLHIKGKGKKHPEVIKMAKIAEDLLIIKQVFQKIKDEKRHIGEYLNK